MAVPALPSAWVFPEQSASLLLPSRVRLPSFLCAGEDSETQSRKWLSEDRQGLTAEVGRSPPLVLRAWLRAWSLWYQALL